MHYEQSTQSMYTSVSCLQREIEQSAGFTKIRFERTSLASV